MVWGILMFICGILAITMPLASSVGIVIVLAWLILFAAVFHLVFAFQSHSVGGFLWKVLLAIVYGLRGLLHVDASAIRRGLSHAPSRYLSRDRRNCGDCFVFQHPRGCERGMGLVRRNCDADPRIFDLASLAVELGVGDRNSRRDQFDF